jgi:hypothetical protein
MPENDPTLEFYNSLMSSGTSCEMPRYKCHKEVWAMKISKIIDPTLPGNESDGTKILVCEMSPTSTGSPVRVDGQYLRQHRPEVGGYYVVYKDGYKSYSPAKAFEEGYTRL